MCVALHLQPAGAAPPGLVRRVERLHHHALVAAARARPRGTAPPRRASSATIRGTRSASGTSASRIASRSRAGRSRSPRRRRGARRRRTTDSGDLRAHRDLGPAPEPAHRHLERCGRPSSRARSPRRRARSPRPEREHGLDDLGDPVGDVGEAPGERAHLAAEPVHLEARAVELPLDRRRSPSRSTRSSRSSAVCASIGFTGRKSVQPERARGPRCPSASAAARDRGRGRPRASRARRTEPAGCRRPCATASTITPSSAPWRSSPRSSAARKRCSSLGRPGEERRRARPGGAPGSPARRRPRCRPIASSTSSSSSVGGGSAAGEEARGAGPTPRRPSPAAARRRGRRRRPAPLRAAAHEGTRRSARSCGSARTSPRPLPTYERSRPAASEPFKRLDVSDRSDVAEVEAWREHAFELEEPALELQSRP